MDPTTLYSVGHGDLLEKDPRVSRVDVSTAGRDASTAGEHGTLALDAGQPARDTLRLQCGVERPAGELLAVAETGGKALVVFGSFNSSEVQFSRLAPPHQWASEGIMGTESQSMWHGAATLSLLPQASLRLSGLALWRAAPAAPPELHAVLEAPSAAGEFGRPKRELFHRSESLAEEPMSPTTAPKHLEPSGEEGMDRGQEHSPRPGRGSQTSQTLQTLQLQSIAENVAGMRQDTRQLLAGAFRAELDGFG
eukprot:g9523.t1